MEDYTLGTMRPQFGGGGFSTLNAEQMSAAQEIIAGYDASTATEEEKQEMLQKLQEAGIQPGRSLGQLLAENGFNPRELRQMMQGEQAEEMMGRPRGGPPPEMLSESQDGDNNNKVQEDFLTLVRLLSETSNDEDDEAQSQLEAFLEELNQRYQSIGGLVDEET